MAAELMESLIKGGQEVWLLEMAQPVEFGDRMSIWTGAVHAGEVSWATVSHAHLRVSRCQPPASPPASSYGKLLEVVRYQAVKGLAHI